MEHPDDWLRQLEEGRISRREFFRKCAVVGISAAAAAAWAERLPSSAQAAGKLLGPVNFLGWGGHMEKSEVDDFNVETGVKINFTGFDDNADALTKIKLEGGKHYDLVAIDALWVPKYYQEGLIEPLDLQSWPQYQDMFDEFKGLSLWKVGNKWLAQPWAWSPLIFWYNPKHITNNPTSIQFLWDPSLRGRLALPKEPVDIIAWMGIATGAKNPYAMTKGEIAAAKASLIKLKPNILKFAVDDRELITLLSDETAWVSIISAGGGLRVKDAGGPSLKSLLPKEGYIGYYDGDSLVKGAAHRDAAIAWLQHKAKSKYLVANFLRMHRPLAFKGPYDMLVKQGKAEEAHALFYDQPRIIKNMIVKGPPPNIGEYVDAFNEAVAS